MRTGPEHDDPGAAATTLDRLVTGAPTDPPTSLIAGLSVLKGLLLYAAIAAFAGLYLSFIGEIVGADAPPDLDAAMVTAAAALAGVLGSAFAVYIGVPSEDQPANRELGAAIDAQQKYKLRRALSLEPGKPGEPSWPMTVGIWTYAVIGSAVAITYITNQSETPEAIRALAIAFAGYVVAMIYAAYGISPKK